MGMLCRIKTVNLGTYRKLLDNICIVRSEWPRGLIYGSKATCLLGLRVRILPAAWILRQLLKICLGELLSKFHDGSSAAFKQNHR